MDETGLLAEILPEVKAMQGVEQPPEYHPEGDVWTHTLLLLDKLRDPTPELAVGALLHDVGKPPTFRVAERIRFDGHVEEGVRLAHRILGRLKFSGSSSEQVEALVANHMKFADVHKMRESTLKRFLRLPRFEEHLELHRIDCLSAAGRLDSYDLVRQKLEELSHEQIRPVPLVDGRDLIAAGYVPGPLFGRILSTVEDAQLEGRIATKDEAMALVRNEFGGI
jgi:poly(A) polymerase